MMALLKELSGSIPALLLAPKVHCTIFEDNVGCIELVKCSKMRPRTKHIALKYHHFRQHVLNGDVSVLHVDTKEQEADIFTKALDENQFAALRRKIMGW